MPVAGLRTAGSARRPREGGEARRAAARRLAHRQPGASSPSASRDSRRSRSGTRSPTRACARRHAHRARRRASPPTASARAGRRPGVLVTTTGPGAVIGAAGLVEPRMSYVPVVNIATQVSRALLGSGRGGDPRAGGAVGAARCEREVACASHVSAGELPELVAEAFRPGAGGAAGAGRARGAVRPARRRRPTRRRPSRFELGPTPRARQTSARWPRPLRFSRRPSGRCSGRAAACSGPAGRRVRRARRAARRARRDDRTWARARSRPTIRSRRARPATSPPCTSCCAPPTSCSRSGTELGETATAGWSLALEGRLIQVDVRRGAHRPQLPRRARRRRRRARRARGASHRASPTGHRDGAARARGRARAARRAASPTQGAARARVAATRSARRSAATAIAAWDMTISGYSAAPFFPVYEPDTWLYPLGSGTLGYAWPAAIGAKVARPDADVLAVHGDGGILYGLAELLTARQEGIGAKLLIVDDGGYGILRLIQNRAFGRTAGVDLARPGLPRARALRSACPCTRPSRASSTARCARRSPSPGPSVVHLPQVLSDARAHRVSADDLSALRRRDHRRRRRPGRPRGARVRRARRARRGRGRARATERRRSPTSSASARSRSSSTCADEAQWVAAVAAAEERFGPVTTLVNNAGIASPATIATRRSRASGACST